MARKNEGKRFEEDFRDSLNDLNYFYLRLKDSGGWAKSDDLRFTPSNCCDFVLSYQAIGNTFIELAELKSVKEKRLPFTNINYKHLEEMIDKTSNWYFTNAFFYVNFRAEEKTFKANAEDVKVYIDTADRKSFKLEWFEEFGMPLEHKKKRVRYRYFF